MAVITLLVGFVMFYVMRHAPLQRELARSQRVGAEQTSQHAREMKNASAELARVKAELEGLKVAAAAAESAKQDEQASASEPSDATARAARRQAARETRRAAARERAAARAAAREARQARRAALRAEKAANASKKDDRAAETAATTDGDRPAYASQPPPAPRPEPQSSPPSPRDTLTGVLDDTRDPLHGL